jgi:hypothetical protein
VNDTKNKLKRKFLMVYIISRRSVREGREVAFTSIVMLEKAFPHTDLSKQSS